KKRFDESEVAIRVLAEPAIVNGQAFADDLDGFFGVMLVLRKCEHANVHAAAPASVFLKALAGDHGEIAQAGGSENQLFLAVFEIAFLGDRRGTGEPLIFW